MMSPSEPFPPSVPQNRQPFWDYTDLFLFAMSLLAGLGILLVGAPLLRVATLAPAWKLLVPQLILYALVLTPLAVIFRFRYDRPMWVSLGWKSTSLLVTLSSLLAGPLLAISVGIIGVWLRTREIDLPFQPALGAPGTVVLLGIVVVILGPVCEELVFRGFLMPLLIRSLGAAAGILLTGIVFGCMHGAEYEWSWRHMLLISLVGCVFGWAKYKTKSTAASAFMHSTFNLTQFAAFLVHQRSL